IRLVISENSETNALVLFPASVAASISVVNKMAVAKSALHSRQYFSALPGSSNNGSVRPQTLHGAIESCSVPFGPVDMIVPPWFVAFQMVRKRFLGSPEAFIRKA